MSRVTLVCCAGRVFMKFYHEDEKSNMLRPVAGGFAG